MRTLFFTCCLLSFYAAIAQQKIQYYDYSWKPCEPGLARFYSVTEKTDSGWLRRDFFVSNQQLQMQALYADSDCKILDGYAAWFYHTGIPSAVGRYALNKLQGVYVRYHSNGMIADSATYRDGVPAGDRYLWHRNGYMSDSISHLNDSMDVQVSWFDDGSLSAAGYLLRGNPHARWKYYHRNGNIAGMITYNSGNKLSKEYFNEDGSPHPDTSDVNTDAVFKNGGVQGWKKYLEKNSVWPGRYQLTNTDRVTVVIAFTVNENGKTEDAEVYTPFHPEFDEAAVSIIKKSPLWKPAKNQNRKVKQQFRQPVTFMQMD